MSEIVENVSEQKNSAPSNEAAQPTEAVSEEIANNVEEAVPAASETASTETVEASLQKPASEESSSTPPKVDNKKSPVKRSRMSFIERAQKESEELVRTLGGSLEMEGGRKTRSSTRGTPTRSPAASTPPPVKKSRNSPASGTSTPTRGRGRGRKIDTTSNEPVEEETSPTTSKKKTPTKGKISAAKESLDQQDDETNEVVKETDKKPDNETESAISTSKEDNVDSGATAEVVIENINKTVSDEAKEGDKVNKEEVKIEDKTDAVLATVVEETQSQLVAAEAIPSEENNAKGPENVSHVEKVIEESKADGSPMETEEIKSDESEEKEKENIENKKAMETEKQPTPEPMDVDSSSKSNEAFEKMEDKLAVATEKPETSAPALEAETLSAITLNNVVKTVEENVKQNSILIDGAAALSSDIVENNTTGATFDSCNEKSTEETTPAANNDVNKTENDICEPKIATSPPISAATDDTVTTPQTCN